MITSVTPRIFLQVTDDIFLVIARRAILQFLHDFTVLPDEAISKSFIITNAFIKQSRFILEIEDCFVAQFAPRNTKRLHCDAIFTPCTELGEGEAIFHFLDNSTILRHSIQPFRLQ